MATENENNKATLQTMIEQCGVVGSLVWEAAENGASKAEIQEKFGIYGLLAFVFYNTPDTSKERLIEIFKEEHLQTLLPELKAAKSRKKVMAFFETHFHSFVPKDDEDIDFYIKHFKSKSDLPDIKSSIVSLFGGTGEQWDFVRK